MKMINNKKCVLLIAIFSLVAIMTVPLPTSAQVIDSPWPMWRHDPANTGSTDEIGPTKLYTAWKYQTDGPVVSSPAVAGGKVYFGSNDGKIYCLTAHTGSLVWEYETGFPVRSTPAVVDGKVYTGCDNGNIYCLNANTGTVIWDTPTVGGLMKTVLQPTAQIHSSPCVVDGRVYVGHLDGYMYCLDADTGEIIWRYHLITNHRIASSPAVVDGKVYFGATDGYIYCLDADNGKNLWIPFGFDTLLDPPEGILPLEGLTEVDSSPMVHDGVIYIFANRGYWFAINATTREEIWKVFIARYRGTYSVTQSLPIGGMAYANGKTFQCFGSLASAFDAETGKTLWNMSVGYPSYSSATYAAGKVYLASDLPSMYCFDAENGTRYSSFSMGNNVHSSPAVAYGNLYVGCFDWNLYCMIERPPPAAILITADLSTPEIQQGNNLNITGTVTSNAVPVPPPGHNPITVTATFTLPDGNTEDVSAAANGTYTITYSPSTSGDFKVKVLWEGNDDWADYSTGELSFTVLPIPPPKPDPLIPAAWSAGAILAVIVAISVFFYTKFYTKRR